MSTPRIASQTELRDAYRTVTDRVAEAAVHSGRRPQDVHIVAVTKTASPDQIRSLVEMGHRDFAENRVQHLVQRHAQIEEFVARKTQLGGEDEQRREGTEARGHEASRFAHVSSLRSQAPGPKPQPSPIRWHMIGHLQRNKVKQVVPIVKLIHSVDSLRLAEELHAFGARFDPAAEHPIEVLLQVNATGEESKFGLVPPAVPHMAEQVHSMIHLKLRGLMTMAEYSDNTADARPCFARTAELFHDIATSGAVGPDFNILSMGMTGDYEIAIEEGANLVRIGRAIFGEGDGLEG
jgi:PLP dependent protein